MCGLSLDPNHVRSHVCDIHCRGSVTQEARKNLKAMVHYLIEKVFMQPAMTVFKIIGLKRAG